MSKTLFELWTPKQKTAWYKTTSSVKRLLSPYVLKASRGEIPVSKFNEIARKYGATNLIVGEKISKSISKSKPTSKPILKSKPISKPTTTTTITKPTTAKQQEIKQISETLKETKKSAEDISSKLSILKEAKDKGLEITPKTTIEEAKKFLSTGEVENLHLPEYEPTTTLDTEGLEKELESKRTAYEKELQERLNAIQKEKETLIKQIETIKATQKGILEKDIEPLLKPWREKLEKAERERLEIEKNYFANQKTIQEMETLLNQAKQEIQQAESITGLRAIREPRIQKIKEDIQGRIAVLEAVMAARNKQIAVGEELIDRMMDAIQKDRQSRLNYYEALYNFYQQSRDEEGKKLLQLTKDEKEFLDLQTSLIKEELEEARKSAEYIKKLIINPQTAEILERAGVKLTDSVEEINKKLADDAYKQEVINTANKMAEAGWIEIPKAQLYNKPDNEIIKLKDSRGNIHYFWKEGGEATGKEYTPSTPYKIFTETGGEKRWGMDFADWYKEIYKGMKEKTSSDKNADINQIEQRLQAVAGSDGFVNIDDYVKLRNLWKKAYGEVKTFDNLFSSYLNPWEPDVKKIKKYGLEKIRKWENL